MSLVSGQLSDTPKAGWEGIVQPGVGLQRPSSRQATEKGNGEDRLHERRGQTGTSGNCRVDYVYVAQVSDNLVGR